MGTHRHPSPPPRNARSGEAAQRRTGQGRNLRNETLRTLLYYDLWHYPLTARELFSYLPANSITFTTFADRLKDLVGKDICEHDGYYYVAGNDPSIVAERRRKERRARSMWRMARIAGGVIRQFPFVRAVFVSGELAMNAASRGSDVDFFIVTAPRRLWIARSLLILFKKVVLLDRKKFFCVNSFVSADHLGLKERNLYVASEVAHLKPLVNRALYHEYMLTNGWIRRYFPNFYLPAATQAPPADRQSILQMILELPFGLIPADRLDSYLLTKMESIWSKRYPQFDDATRQRICRCTKSESRAYLGNFEDRVLRLYKGRLRQFGVPHGAAE